MESTAQPPEDILIEIFVTLAFLSSENYWANYLEAVCYLQPIQVGVAILEWTYENKGSLKVIAQDRTGLCTLWMPLLWSFCLLGHLSLEKKHQEGKAAVIAGAFHSSSYLWCWCTQQLFSKHLFKKKKKSETGNWTKQGKCNWFATMGQHTLWARVGWALEWLKLLLLSSYYSPRHWTRTISQIPHNTTKEIKSDQVMGLSKIIQPGNGSTRTVGIKSTLHHCFTHHPLIANFFAVTEKPLLETSLIFHPGNIRAGGPGVP